MAGVAGLKIKRLFFISIQIATLGIQSITNPPGVCGYPSSILANQLPRFNVPSGNLSYYRSPYWEVLYLLKFKNLPFYSTTNDRPLLQRIKSFLGSDGHMIYNNNNNQESTPHANLFLSSGTGSEVYPNAEEDNGFLSTKKKMKTARRSAKNQKKKNRNRKLKFVVKKSPSPNYDVFADEYDDEGLDSMELNRVVKQAGERYERKRGRFGGIQMQMGGENPQGVDGELALETTINRKINRKFQTQGWRK